MIQGNIHLYYRSSNKWLPERIDTPHEMYQYLEAAYFPYDIGTPLLISGAKHLLDNPVDIKTCSTRDLYHYISSIGRAQQGVTSCDHRLTSLRLDILAEEGKVNTCRWGLTGYFSTKITEIFDYLRELRKIE